MRTPAEIQFRLRQEIGNLADFLIPGRVSAPGPTEWAPLPALPAREAIRERLRGTAAAREIAHLAGRIRTGEIPIFGQSLPLGTDPEWRRDPATGIATEPAYFRRIPYLDPAAAGDHKFVWELNRHQHLVVLAQDFLLHATAESAALAGQQILAWRAANPYLRGMNWTSALEVAFRALSWIWIWHLAGDGLPEVTRRAILTGLTEHGRYLERNLSIYFSPNTHVLGEALALHAIAVCFPSLSRAGAWRELGDRTVRDAMSRQVAADGSHIEQSSFYHVYALDMFLLHAILAPPDGAYLDKLEKMGDFLAALLGSAGRIPLVGDDDGGRLFHPYGERDRFGAASLASLGIYLTRHGRKPSWTWTETDCDASAVWWLGERTEGGPAARNSASKAFPNSGLVLLSSGALECWLDAGPFGPGGAGHSHADGLQIILRSGGDEILVDAGTYTYVGDAAERNRFRGSAMHNTIRVDGGSQAEPAGPFRWATRPGMTAGPLVAGTWGARVFAECSYAGIRHRRELGLAETPAGTALAVVDTVSWDGKAERDVEQFWHAGCPVEQEAECAFRFGPIRLEMDSGGVLETGGEYGWRSRVLGQKEESPVVRRLCRAAAPAVLTSLWVLGEAKWEIRSQDHPEGGFLLAGPGGTWGIGGLAGDRESAAHPPRNA